MKLSNILGDAVIFLFGALTTILSVQMPIGAFRAPGSGLFPLCLGVVLMILSTASMLQGIGPSVAKKRIEACAVEAQGSPWMVLPFLGIVVLTTLLLNTLGYAVVSFLLMIGLLRVLGSKRWLFNLMLSLFTAVGSHILFIYLLKIPLPMSFLGI